MYLGSHITSRIQEARRSGAPLSDPAVLIVEDDAALKPLWISVFAQVAPGARIDWVLTEEAAERKIRERVAIGELYDIIIADIFLSGKRSGLDLWRRYGMDGSEFVVVTGASPEKVAALTKDEEMPPPRFLHKPLEPKALLSLITELLGMNEKGGARAGHG